MGLFDALGDVFGHVMTMKSRKYGKTTHYWAVCSCGYESKPGKSSVFAMNSGAGHLARIRKRVEAGIDAGDYDTRTSPGTSATAGGRA